MTSMLLIGGVGVICCSLIAYVAIQAMRSSEASHEASLETIKDMASRLQAGTLDDWASHQESEVVDHEPTLPAGDPDLQGCRDMRAAGLDPDNTTDVWNWERQCEGLMGGEAVGEN